MQHNWTIVTTLSDVKKKVKSKMATGSRQNRTFISAFMMKSMQLLTRALTLHFSFAINNLLLLVYLWNPKSRLSAPGIELGPPASKRVNMCRSDQ